MLTMYEVKLHMKCSRDLKSRSLRDQRILVARYVNYLNMDPERLKATPKYI